MRIRLFVLALAFFAAGCSTTSGSTRVAHEGPWIQPSAEFQRQIDQHAARLPYLQKLDDFVAEIQWFVGAGEPAYATLLELAASTDTKVSGAALAALGSMNDARLVPHLDQLPWPAEDQARARYERARCHLKLGDWSHVGVLIDGLGDGDLYARSLCFRALNQATGESFDYHPKAEVAVREASMARWSEWAARTGADVLQQR